MPAHPIVVAGLYFPSKKALKDRIKAILNGSVLGHKLQGEDALLIAALFDRHPEKTIRLEGLAISHFEIRKTAYPTRSFHVIRTDGVAIDFSMSNCI